MNYSEFREFVNKQQWTFARKYAPFAPHEYIIRGKNGVTDEAFFKAAQCILEHGMKMFYYGHERKYLFVDGRFYWLMSKEITDSTIVINRCVPEDYDIIFIRRNTNPWVKKDDDKPVQLEMDLGGNS